MKWKNRLTNCNFWVSIVSAALLVMQNFNVQFDINNFNDIITAVLGLLVVIGIINDPTKSYAKIKEGQSSEQTVATSEQTDAASKQQQTETDVQTEIETKENSTNKTDYTEGEVVEINGDATVETKEANTSKASNPLDSNTALKENEPEQVEAEQKKEGDANLETQTNTQPGTTSQAEEYKEGDIKENASEQVEINTVIDNESMPIKTQNENDFNLAKTTDEVFVNPTTNCNLQAENEGLSLEGETKASEMVEPEEEDLKNLTLANHNCFNIVN